VSTTVSTERNWTITDTQGVHRLKDIFATLSKGKEEGQWFPQCCDPNSVRKEPKLQAPKVFKEETLLPDLRKKALPET
jgi:hypothetical protein